MKEKGFTLIEVLIVVAILGALSVVTIVAINPVKRFQDSRNSIRESDVSQIFQAVNAYVLDNQGVFPTINSGALKTLSISTGTATCAVADECNATDLDGIEAYLPEIPTDPLGNEYLVGVDDSADPKNIIVGTNQMEINDTQTQALFYQIL